MERQSSPITKRKMLEARFQTTEPSQSNAVADQDSEWPPLPMVPPLPARRERNTNDDFQLTINFVKLIQI